MMLTAPPAAAIPQTTPDAAREVRAAQMQALLDLVATFQEDDWDRPTDCDRWTVREMIAHVVGAADEALHFRVFLRHWVLLPRRRYPELSVLDGANECQVDDRRDRSGTQIAVELADLGPRAMRALATLKRRRLRVPKSDPLLPGASMVYMFDVIAPRDVWMHRVDAARAIGRPLVLGEHDRQVVAQVVRDLGRAWQGPAVLLELSGPAGGVWTLGDGEPVATVVADAVEYLRTLSGRNDAPELSAAGDSSAIAAVRTARVVF